MTYFEIFDKHFPKELAEKAKKNTEFDRECPANLVGDSTFYNGALAYAFAWEKTPEGHKYWSEINNRYDRVQVQRES